MAWNGGVSLAVWMGGVSVELDAARRARLSAPDKSDPEPVVSSARTSAALYEALCYAFDRRLVIDILAGASAGGLNGALLAGAIAHQRVLTPEFLRGRWLELGDFDKLLQPVEKKDPASIMQGGVFLARLRSVFADLLGTTGPPASGDCEAELPVLLDVQATDVQGDERCFVDDWDEPFYALEFRSPIRFRKLGDFTAETLAVAARASSSFPAAFEPQELDESASRLAGFGGAPRWAIDGGLLENAPIRPAIELIPRRGASSPTQRFVCYVNAAPTARRELLEEAGQPTLANVLSYTVNLPRDGRVIDQLTALEEAKRHAGITADAGVRLLALSAEALKQVATALLSTYQRRRALLSLQELLEPTDRTRDNGAGPGSSRSVLRRLDRDARATGENAPAGGAVLLPWIPGATDPPQVATDWRWGVRPAQRILQLELDVLRAVLLATTSETEADAIFAARQPIDWTLTRLDSVHTSFMEQDEVTSNARQLNCPNPAARQAALQALSNETRGCAQTVADYLRPATGSFYKALKELSEESRTAARLPELTQLFGETVSEPELDEDAYQTFLRHTLPIEVIRRSFADDLAIEASQTLHVAQLTPLIAAPLFSMGRPDPTITTDPPSQMAATSGPQSGAVPPPTRIGPITVKDKLAGIRLNHFAGFYRASWRANDFMWGRLDGAAAIARLLVDANRAQVLTTLDRAATLKPAAQLARALVPLDGADEEKAADQERLQLLWELLAEKTDRPATAATPPADEVHGLLEDAIEADLASEKAEFTWAVCARALQYEVLREEAPQVLAQSKVDKSEGGYRTSLGWENNGRLMPIIKDLRGASGDNALPRRLGCDDPDEATSTLALRILSHTLLVALSALAGAVPLTKAVQPARVPLFTVAGITSLKPLNRLAAVLGFAGAAWYLAARWLTLPAKPDDSIPLSAVWSPQVLALWISMLAVLGVVAVPFLRALQSPRWPRRLWNAGTATIFLATGGLVALVWQWIRQGTIEALTAWHATYLPPTWLLWAVVGIGGVHATASLDSVLRIVGPLMRSLGRWISYTALLLGGIATALAVLAASNVLIPSLFDGGMKAVVAILALAGPGLLACYLRVWKRPPAESP